MQQYDQIADALSQQWKHAYRILLNCTLIIFIRLNWYKSHSTFVVFYFLRIWKFWYRDSLDYIFFSTPKYWALLGSWFLNSLHIRTYLGLSQYSFVIWLLKWLYSIIYISKGIFFLFNRNFSMTNVQARKLIFLLRLNFSLTS